MKKEEVEEAATAIQKLSRLQLLRADLITSKYRLRMYANKNGEDTMHDEVEIEDREFARDLIAIAMEKLEKRLSELGVQM